ncbi:MAG: virulence RhuM family protein [Candidatus Gracilibacteria bacterium]
MKNSQPNNEIIIYKTADEKISVSVRFEDETAWLTQAQLVELFGSSKANVSEHIKHIFEESELQHDSVVRKFRTTAVDGKSYNIEYYNLDMIISLGYRIKSSTATKFRQWATERLREYIQKGFTMDDERLKQAGGGSYWKELLERIRDIRSSEKIFYRQILDIYATSIDYEPKADESIEFFKKVQNKIHYAVHGHTAAELIYSRVDAEKEFMGLTTFSGDIPHLADAVIAKNYLKEKELRALNRIVSGYLDFAERQAEREIAMKMKDWAQHLDGILTATGEQLLQNAGSISHEQALEKAKTEYKKFQAKTLSSAERNYLENIKTLQKKVEKNGKLTS